MQMKSRTRSNEIKRYIGVLCLPPLGCLYDNLVSCSSLAIWTWIPEYCPIRSRLGEDIVVIGEFRGKCVSKEGKRADDDSAPGWVERW